MVLIHVHVSINCVDLAIFSLLILSIGVKIWVNVFDLVVSLFATFVASIAIFFFDGEILNVKLFVRFITDAV